MKPDQSMTSADFTARYQLLSLIADGSVRSLHARATATGKVVMVHYLVGTPAQNQSVLDRAERLGLPQRTRVIEVIDIQGHAVLVTHVLSEFSTLEAWLDRQLANQEEHREARRRTPAGGPVVPAPPRPAPTLPPPTFREAQTMPLAGQPVEHRPTVPPAPPISPVQAPPRAPDVAASPAQPPAAAAPGEFTRLFKERVAPHGVPQRPVVRAPVIPSPTPVGQTAPQAPTPPNLAPGRPAAPPPLAPSAAPSRPPSPAAPGEFTRLFRPVTDEPDSQAGAPPSVPVMPPSLSPSPQPAFPPMGVSPVRTDPVLPPPVANSKRATGMLDLRPAGPAPLPEQHIVVPPVPAPMPSAPPPPVIPMPALSPLPMPDLPSAGTASPVIPSLDSHPAMAPPPSLPELRPPMMAVPALPPVVAQPQAAPVHAMSEFSKVLKARKAPKKGAAEPPEPAAMDEAPPPPKKSHLPLIIAVNIVVVIIIVVVLYFLLRK